MATAWMEPESREAKSTLTWSHSKEVDLIEVEGRTVVTKVTEGDGWRAGLKGYTISDRKSSQETRWLV